MKILLTGGGTLGSVSPLIAIYEEAIKQNKTWEWFWVGTRTGVEKDVVKSLGINYEWLPTSKFRRYFSLQTIFEPISLLLGFIRSLLIIINVKPNIIIGAGSFVSVPVIWAGWIMRKKIIIHQQDIKPTLSNKLTSFCASKITVSFSKSLRDFPRDKTQWTGNPVRDNLLHTNPKIIVEKFNLNPDLKTLLVTGGSSGSVELNKWVWDNINILSQNINVIHLTGIGKSNKEIKAHSYKQIEFLDKDMFNVLSLSDVVVTRAGISTITELAYLNKPSIIIPIPDSHQEDNAFYVSGEHAAIIYRQNQLNELVARKTVTLLHSKDEQEKLSLAIGKLMRKNSRETIVDIIKTYEPK